MVRRISILLLVLLLLLGLSACRNQTSDPRTNRYYEGYKGIETHFTRLPPRLYYYQGMGPEQNAVDLEIEVRNEGASFARGGVYLSGFDPNLFTFEDIHIDPDGAGACALDISNLATGSLGAVFRCDGVTIGSNSGGGLDFRFEDLASTIDSVFGSKISSQKLFRNPIRLDVSTFDNDKYRMDFSWDGVDFEYAKRGRLFLALFAGLDFDRYNGIEYILAGDMYEYPGGETLLHTYRGFMHDWPAGLDELRQNFLVTSCYQYTTYATPSVCIDPEPYNAEIRKVCQAKTYTTSGGQGAPVAITSVFQENTPLKVRFDFEIQNVGKGKIWDPGYLEYCSPYYPGRPSSRMTDVVYIGDVRVGTASMLSGDPRLECTPDHAVRLQNGRGRFTCSYDISRLRNLKSAFETPLVVELWYGYSDSELRTVQIKRVA